MVHILLEQEAPGLAAKLGRLSLNTRRVVLARAAAFVAAALGGLEGAGGDLLQRLASDEDLGEADVELAQSLAEAADSRYFELQERDPGAALRPFCEARLLTALAVGFGGMTEEDSADAAYELCKVSAEPSGVVACIESEIRRLAEG